MKILFLLFLISLNCFSFEYVIIHNSNDKLSRDFIENTENKGYKIIDYYNETNEDAKEFRKKGILISKFPSVVELESKVVIDTPSTVALAKIAIADYKEFKLKKAMNDIEFGKQMIAWVRVTSIERNLTEEQVQAIETNFANVILKMQLGKLKQAKALIQAVNPDGVLVTRKLKDELIRSIEEYSGE